MKSLARTPLGICFLLAVIASGCALTTAHVDLAYLPEPEKKSPLGTISRMRVALEVEDQRPADERTWVGNKRNGFGAVTAYVQSNKDVTAVIRDAVTKELINNGHTIVDAKDAPSDAGISVDLKRYWSDARMHFWDIEMIGTLQADVNIRDPRKNLADLSKPIVSTFRESRQIATDGAHESVLNGALAEFIRSFSRDPGIIKTLKDASAQKEESGTEKQAYE
jgi:hypothetical protein